MLDLDPERAAAEPRPASTLVLLRDGAGGVEVCVMQRSLKSSFLGGAVAFPGGRLEESDAAAQWPPDVAKRAEGRWSDDEGTGFRIAACREALEEVGIVPITGAPLGVDELRSLRVACAAGPEALRDALRASGRALDLASLVPLSRWMTPTAERRRYDARFFVARAPAGQGGSSDDHEALRVLWGTPRALLASSEKGEIALFPPTHRTLENLLDARDVDDALARCVSTNLDVVCPTFVMAEGVPTLALPGDPLHDVPERRIAGSTRYVLRGERWESG